MFEVLIRIQPFPDSRMAKTSLSPNAAETANAFPPAAAKMPDLAIRTAAAGIEFGYDRAPGVRIQSNVIGRARRMGADLLYWEPPPGDKRNREYATALVTSFRSGRLVKIKKLLVQVCGNAPNGNLNIGGILTAP